MHHLGPRTLGQPGAWSFLLPPRGQTCVPGPGLSLLPDPSPLLHRRRPYGSLPDILPAVRLPKALPWPCRISAPCRLCGGMSKELGAAVPVCMEDPAPGKDGDSGPGTGVLRPLQGGAVSVSQPRFSEETHSVCVCVCVCVCV